MRLRPRELRAIFKERKLFLEELHFRIDDYKAMDAFASGGVATLRSIYVFGDFPAEGAFFSLVANNESLHHVDIAMDALPEKVEHLVERVREIADCFMKAPALLALDIGNDIGYRWPEIVCSEFFKTAREMVRTKYRHRRVLMRICGRDFC